MIDCPQCSEPMSLKYDTLCTLLTQRVTRTFRVFHHSKYHSRCPYQHFVPIATMPLSELNLPCAISN